MKLSDMAKFKAIMKPMAAALRRILRAEQAYNNHEMTGDDFAKKVTTILSDARNICTFNGIDIEQILKEV